MFKKLAPVLLFNAIIGLIFVLSNNYVWSILNGKLSWNEWSPFQIAIAPQIVYDGQTSPAGLFVPFPNYPFILFWVAMIGNLCFFILTLRSKETKM